MGRQRWAEIAASGAGGTRGAAWLVAIKPELKQFWGRYVPAAAPNAAMLPPGAVIKQAQGSVAAFIDGMRQATVRG